MCGASDVRPGVRGLSGAPGAYALDRGRANPGCTDLVARIRELRIRSCGSGNYGSGRADPGTTDQVVRIRDVRRTGQAPPVCTWKAARRTALARAGSGWAAARATRTWTVRGWPTALTSSRRDRDGAPHCGVEMAHQESGLAVVGDGGGRVDPEPGGLLTAERRPGRRRGRCPRTRRARAARRGAARFGEDGADLGFGGGADDARSASKASPRSSASSPRATASSSATRCRRCGRRARRGIRRGPARGEPGAAEEHVGGGLFDVSGRALGGDADLFQLDPDRPVAERGEGGVPFAEGQRSDGGEALQGPVEQQGVEVGARAGAVARSAAWSAAVSAGPAGAPGAVLPGPRGTSQRSSWSSATRWPRRSSRAGTVTGPAESWRRRAPGARPRRLRRPRPPRCPRVRGGRATRRRRAPPSRAARRSRPGPRRAAAAGRAVSPCSSTSPASRARSQPARTCAGESSGRRPHVRGVGRERGWRCRGPGAGRPVGDAYGVGEHRPGLAGQFRAGRGALGGRGAGLVRRLVTALRAVARGRGRTSRSLESRGVRDVTGAVLPLTARKPKAEAVSPVRERFPGAAARGEFTPSAHIRGVRKRRRVSS